MSKTNKKQARDGRSLTLSHDNISQKQLIEFGLSVDAAKRAVYVRRVLPYMEDATVPCIDAKELWAKLGKPHKRFRDWADYNVRPLLDDAMIRAEISALEYVSKTGSPSKNYTLSRNLAVHLAMQAKTSEGWDVRSYFMDMEKIVFKMAEYNQSRVVIPLKIDNRLTHATYKRCPVRATEHERMLKSRVCEVLTGIPARVVREQCGMGIRDVLKNYPDQLEVYNDAYKMAVTMYEDGKKWVVIQPIIANVFGRKIDIGNLHRI